MKRLLFLGALAASLLFFACQGNVIFEEEQKIPAGGWRYADTLNFSFPVTDTTLLYNLLLDFEYADTFPDQNLYVNLHTLFPDGKRLHKMKSFEFFGPDGKPLGRCSGHTCRSTTMLQENAFFKLTGTYMITIEQFGRREALAGVKSVALRVEKTGKKRGEK